MGAAHHRTVIRESRFWLTYQRQRYTILFYSLLATLIAMPLAATIGLPTVLIRILVAASLFAAVMPSATPRTRGILLGGVFLLLLARFASVQGYLNVNPAFFLVLVGFTGLAAAAGSLRYAISAHDVGAETIYAALSTYLLAGLFFGQIYFSVETMSPGSIVGPDPTTELTSVYYSFVTLATLGYGDYLPRTDIARGLATFEVIGGQLFLAVLVARLIGAFGPQQPKR